MKDLDIQLENGTLTLKLKGQRESPDDERT